MEIKGTQSRPSIFPALHWFIYITEICHWRNIHKLRPNQTCLKDWRGISQRGAECLFDWFVNFSCTKIPRMVWPTLIYVLFWIGRIFIWGGSQRIWLPCWLDFQALRFHCQGSIELSFRTTSTALAPLSARWEAESERLAFSSSAFKANPQLGSAEGFHSHPDWGKYAGHSVSNFWFPREGTANPPSLLLQWWKGDKCRMRSWGYGSCSDEFALGGCLVSNVWHGTKREGESSTELWCNYRNLTKLYLHPLYPQELPVFSQLHCSVVGMAMNLLLWSRQTY